MRGSDLLNKMELVDAIYVEAADSATVKRGAGTIKWCAAAAISAIVVTGGIWFGKPDISTVPLDLPQLEADLGFGAMGFEGYLAYSPDELADNSPWNEALTPETMPVFKNRYPADQAGYSAVEQQARMDFDPPAELPAYLNFHWDATYEELATVAEYLKAEYADTLDMSNPVTDIQGGDRDIYGRRNYTLHFYDGTGDMVQQLISRSLSSQWWCHDDKGRLMLVWKNQYDLSEPMGEYPVISADEARKLLCQGNYITSVPYAMPGKKYIVQTELLYRNDRSAQYFMPYYRFLVEIPEAYFGQPRVEEQSGTEVNGNPAGDLPNKTSADIPDGGTGMKTYGAYYVPAVKAEYLTRMPVWNDNVN